MKSARIVDSLYSTSPLENHPLPIDWSVVVGPTVDNVRPPFAEVETDEIGGGVVVVVVAVVVVVVVVVDGNAFVGEDVLAVIDALRLQTKSPFKAQLLSFQNPILLFFVLILKQSSILPALLGSPIIQLEKSNDVPSSQLQVPPLRTPPTQ